MLKIEIDLWPILYGTIFFLIYMTFINLKRKVEKNSKNENNYISKDTNIMNIECSCQTFYIDEKELLGCEYCIKKHFEYIEDGKKKKKKCMSFPA